MIGIITNVILYSYLISKINKTKLINWFKPQHNNVTDRQSLTEQTYIFPEELNTKSPIKIDEDDFIAKHKTKNTIIQSTTVNYTESILPIFAVIVITILSGLFYYYFTKGSKQDKSKLKRDNNKKESPTKSKNDLTMTTSNSSLSSNK